VLQFSNIAFNRERSRALIYFDWHCGNLCGFGNMVLLKKTKGGWVVEDYLGGWIS
jgi:hypothetical protein